MKATIRGPRHSLPALLTTLALCLTTLSPSVHATSADGDLRARPSYASDARDAVNAARSDRRLRALRTNACLARFAQRHATRLAQQGTLYHQPAGPMKRRCGLRSALENVAYGYPSGRAAVDAWLADPPHRAPLLKGDARVIGIGTASSQGATYISLVVGTPGR